MKRCSGEEDAIYFIWLLLPLFSTTGGRGRLMGRRGRRKLRELRRLRRLRARIISLVSLVPDRT